MRKITFLFLFTISTIKIVSIAPDPLFSSTISPRPTPQRLNIFKVIDKLSSPAILAERQSNPLFFNNLLNSLHRQDPNIFQTQNEANMTPLMYAIEKGEEIFAFKLLEKYPQEVLIHEQDNQGNTALHHAIKNKFFTLTCDLLRLGADINAQNNLGQTPLHLAFKNQDLESAQTLLLLHANPNIPDAQGRTALHIFTKNLHYDTDTNISLLNLLLDCDVNINAQDQFGFTPLHMVIINNTGHNHKNHIDFAHALLAHNANPTLLDSALNTPLHAAVLHHTQDTPYEEIIQELIPKTNPNIRNNYNETPENIVKKFEKSDLYSLFNIQKNSTVLNKLFPQSPTNDLFPRNRVFFNPSPIHPKDSPKQDLVRYPPTIAGGGAIGNIRGSTENLAKNNPLLAKNQSPLTKNKRKD